MRRRPKADAPTTDDTTIVASLPEAASDNPLPADTPAAPDATPNNAAEAAAETADAATPRPRRRTPRRKAEEADATPAEVPADALSDAAPAVSAQIADAPVTEPPAEAPARRPRAPRRKAVAPETPVEVEADATPAPVAEAVVADAVAPTVEPVDAAPTEAAPAETRPSRRRSGRRTADATPPAEADTPPVTPTDAPAPVEPVAEATDAAPAEAPDAETEGEPATGDAPARSRRSRGGRRKRTDAPESPDTPTTIAEAAPVETPPSASDPAQSGTPRRVRGPRRTAVAAASETAPVAFVPLTPVEPLPPPYQALPAEVLANLAEGRVASRKGLPELHIAGAARLPLWFFVNTEDALFGDDADARETARRQIRMAYEAGIRIFSVLAHLPWKARGGERRYGPLDTALDFIAENAPDAYVLPRLIFSPPSSWERAHPDEMTRYEGGETGDVSLASRPFWEGEADEALRAAVEYVAQGRHAGRVWGFYLEHGEWFHEKGRGFDYSDANTRGFQTWLKTRYRGSQVALRAAWYDGAVTFDTAAIPPALPPAAPGASLFLSTREQRYADFHEYSSDIIAQVITRLGKAVKEASGGRSAVAVSYGYTLELTRAGSGHLALAQVLASPDIDILTGPVSYSGRTTGGSAPLPAPVDSVILAGKLWVSEDDTKTHLAGPDAPDNFNPKIPTLEGTIAAHARNFGAALARGAGISWMDLWGQGWLDDRALWQNISRLRQIAEGIARRRQDESIAPAPQPDVAVIVDERSYFDVRTDETLLNQLVANQRDTLLRSGARVGFYLLSDLLKPNFPAGPRLLLFLNAFNLPDSFRTTLRERYQDDGRTLAWVYAPGTCETNPAELTDTLGMQIRLQPWGSKMGTQITANRSPLTDLLRGQRLGEEVRVNPSYFVSDARATTLGEYTQTGNPSLAHRKHDRWQSVFTGEMGIPLPLLRGLYKLAGVPTYTVDDDVAWVGDNLLCLHSAPGGGTTVYLPNEGVLYDLLTGDTLASDGQGARLSMPPRGTRLLFWGSPDEVRQLGGDPQAGPPGLTPSEVPATPPAFVFASVAPAPTGSVAPTGREAAEIRARLEISPEDEALMEAALRGEFPLDDPDLDTSPVVGATAEADVAATDAASDEAKKRRRRRRRGRGRAGENDALLLPDDIAAEGEEDTDDANEADDITTNPPAPAPAPPISRADAQRAALDDGTVAAAAFALGLPAPSGAETRTARPSLAELLPLSEADEGVDLPPVPDELLPMQATGEDDATDAEAAPAPRRTRRRTVGAGLTARRRASRNTGEPGDVTAYEPGEAFTGPEEVSAPSSESADSE